MQRRQFLKNRKIGEDIIDNKIYYITSDYKIIKLNNDDFNASITLNTRDGDKNIIVFDNSVTSIGWGAFDGCFSLTTITIPESVTSIGKEAFFNCKSLASIDIPEGVTSIGSQAFYYCSSLTSINIPESVTSIGNYAFSGCRSLTSIVVAEGNVVYDSRNGCNAIIKINSNALIVGCSTTIIPDSVTSIGEYAFDSCSELISIILPDRVTSIGNYAFYKCSNLISVTLPDSMTGIGYGAFRDCSSLTSIDIPEGVTSIRNYTFDGCSSLTTVTLPESVTSIGDYAFYGCKSLASVNIPESVTSIGDRAFSGCSKLTAITCYAITPPTIDNDTFYNVEKSIPVYVPEDSVEAYKTAEYWSEFTNFQPPSIASGTCGDNLTWRLTEEYELVIGGTGDMYNYRYGNAPWYEYREMINMVILPDGLTSIGNQAFNDYSNLTSINIPASVTSIGEYAFSYCNNLTSITIPEDSQLTSIGHEAFYNCSNLVSITIPASVTSIGASTFNGCSSLASITSKAITPPSVSIYAFNYVSKSIPVYVPAESVSAYQSANYWKEFTNIQAI